MFCQTDLETMALSEVLEIKSVLDSGVFSSLLALSVQTRRNNITSVFMFQCDDLRVRTSPRLLWGLFKIESLMLFPPGWLYSKGSQASNFTQFKNQVTLSLLLLLLWLLLLLLLLFYCLFVSQKCLSHLVKQQCS